LHTGWLHPTWNGGGSSMQAIGPLPRGISPDGPTCQPNISKPYSSCFASCAGEFAARDHCDPCWWSHCLDDVAYVIAILDQLEAQYAVDNSSIFATGCSNGGMFLYTLIADPRIAHRIAAVAPVAGLPHNGFLFPPLNRRLRFLTIWGRADDYVVAQCNVPGRPDKSFSHRYGWYYSCLPNTTRFIATSLGIDPHQGPRPLHASAPESQGAGRAATAVIVEPPCHGWTRDNNLTQLTAAVVADCSWNGPHGWPGTRDADYEDGEHGRGGTGRRWATRTIASFFLRTAL
jgi:hypothetical protein